MGASFLLVQHAISSLEQDGIVECVSRRGTYVRTGWEYRRIRNHMLLREPGFILPWREEFRKLLAEELPELRLAHSFDEGMFELRVTLYLQEHREEYLDLSPYLPEEIRFLETYDRIYHVLNDSFDVVQKDLDVLVAAAIQAGRVSLNLRKKYRYKVPEALFDTLESLLEKQNA